MVVPMAPTSLNAPALVRRLAELPARRISPGDSNHFCIVFDEPSDGCGFVAVIEIFEPDGATPPNAHLRAHEMFFVLAGTGRATCGAETFDLQPGSALLVRPGAEHVVTNTGADRLYCLTVMTPDEDFSNLIRSGVPFELDAQDLAVLGGDWGGTSR